jgi:hypothetical protein
VSYVVRLKKAPLFYKRGRGGLVLWVFREENADVFEHYEAALVLARKQTGLRESIVIRAGQQLQLFPHHVGKPSRRAPRHGAHHQGSVS